MFATLFLVIVIFVLLSILTLPEWKKNYPPGLFSIIGNRSFVERLARELGGQHLAFTEISKRWGSDVISLRMGMNRIVVVSGKKCVQEALSNEQLDGRPWNEFIKIRNMGRRSGITMNDGVEWRELRNWLLRTFRSVGFGKSEMSNLIKNELAEVLNSLKGGGVLKIKEAISPAVINVLWSLTAGKRFCECVRLQDFADMMDRRTRIFDMVGGFLSTFPWIRYIAPEASGYNLLVRLNNELFNFFIETINEHKKNYIPGSEADLIDMFLAEMFKENKVNCVYTDNQLVMLLVDLFLAGCTTTTKTLDFLFLNMVLHQDVQQKLHEEIDSVIPSDRLPDLSDRPKLPYTEAVLAESQRMWVVTPVIGPRRILQETHIDKYTLPKDSMVVLNVYSVNMDPDLHPDPHTFKPERFLKNGIYEPSEDVIFFGRGRRRCPGEALARSALFLIFVGVMQKYKLLPVVGKGPYNVEYTAGLMLTPKPYETLFVPR